MRVALALCPLCPQTGLMVFLRRVTSPSVLCMGSDKAVLQEFWAVARPSYPFASRTTAPMRAGCRPAVGYLLGDDLGSYIGSYLGFLGRCLALYGAPEFTYKLLIGLYIHS
eukprot:scaffold1616_cov395-Prasinococcus_capsulatus_cf.AAC.3